MKRRLLSHVLASYYIELMRELKRVEEIGYFENKNQEDNHFFNLYDILNRLRKETIHYYMDNDELINGNYESHETLEKEILKRLNNKNVAIEYYNTHLLMLSHRQTVNFKFYDLIKHDIIKIKVKDFLIDSNLSQRFFDDMKYISIPSKKHIIAVGIGLKYNLEMLQQLLNKCGYHLSSNILFDKCIIECLNSGITNVYDINEILYEKDLELLGVNHRT